MCVYIYIYIYIYGWMYMRGSLCAFVDEWPKTGSYLWHLWLPSECLEGFLHLLWHEDHTKSCASINLQDQKRRMKRDSQEQDPKAVSPEQRNIQSLEWDTEVGNWKVSTMTRIVSIFGSCVGLSQSSHDGYEHKYIQEC